MTTPHSDGREKRKPSRRQLQLQQSDCCELLAKARSDEYSLAQRLVFIEQMERRLLRYEYVKKKYSEKFRFGPSKCWGKATLEWLAAMREMSIRDMAEEVPCDPSRIAKALRDISGFHWPHSNIVFRLLAAHDASLHQSPDRPERRLGMAMGLCFVVPHVSREIQGGAS